MPQNYEQIHSSGDDSVVSIPHSGQTPGRLYRYPTARDLPPSDLRLPRFRLFSILEPETAPFTSRNLCMAMHLPSEMASQHRLPQSNGLVWSTRCLFLPPRYTVASTPCPTVIRVVPEIQVSFLVELGRRFATARAFHRFVAQLTTAALLHLPSPCLPTLQPGTVNVCNVAGGAGGRNIVGGRQRWGWCSGNAWPPGRWRLRGSRGQRIELGRTLWCQEDRYESGISREHL